MTAASAARLTDGVRVLLAALEFDARKGLIGGEQAAHKQEQTWFMRESATAKNVHTTYSKTNERGGKTKQRKRTFC